MNYEPLPPPSGPAAGIEVVARDPKQRRGVEEEFDGLTLGAHKGAERQNGVQTNQGGEAGRAEKPTDPAPNTPIVDARVRGLAGLLNVWRGTRLPGSAAEASTGPVHEGRRGQAEGARAGVEGPRPRLRVLFAGDSLIAGVGCLGGEAVFPRRVARALADDLEVDVAWRVLGASVGGDVPALQALLRPHLEPGRAAGGTAGGAAGGAIDSGGSGGGGDGGGGGFGGGPPPCPEAAASTAASVGNGCAPRMRGRAAEVEETAAGADRAIVADDTGEGEVDVVVVMCGLNDWKRVLSGTKSPEVFHRDLSALSASFHARFGGQCRVVLPALPLHWTTAFPQPLRSVVLGLGDAWDDQKRRLAAESRQQAEASPACEDGPQHPWQRGDARRGGGSGSGGGGGVGVVDFVVSPPGFPEGVLARDGVHPNEKGYALWADHVARSIAEGLATSKAGAPRHVAP